MNDETGCCAALRRILGRENVVRPLLGRLDAAAPALAFSLTAEFERIMAECRRGLRDDDDDSRGSSGPGDPAVIDPIIIAPSPARVRRDDEDPVPAW